MTLGCSPFLILISDRFRHVIDQHEFKGWTSYAVEVYTKRRARVPSYSGLSITGRAGEVDWTRSGNFIHAPLLDGASAYPAYRGMYFDEGSWDGSDLFLLGETGRLVVTEEVRAALRSEKIRNVSYRRLSEVETSFLIVRHGGNNSSR